MTCDQMREKILRLLEVTERSAFSMELRLDPNGNWTDKTSQRYRRLLDSMVGHDICLTSSNRYRRRIP